MKKILLDSDGYTSFLKGSKEIQKELETADKVFMSVIVLGELFAAFKKGKLESDNLKLLEKFLNKLTVEIIKVSKETAKVYANAKMELEKMGTPIPTNDLWIAAHVLETGSILITFDRHYENISNLRIWEYD